MDLKIKKAAHKAFSYIKDNKLDFTPESYEKAFCEQAKILGFSFEECDWFGAWCARFEGALRRELYNYPIKTKDDFIAVVARFSAESEPQGDALRALDKALKILKKKNIANIAPGLPISAIDAQLGAILREDSAQDSQKDSKKLLDKMQLKNVVADCYAADFGLLCSIKEASEIRQKLGLEAFNKLFSAFYGIILQNAAPSDTVGVYDENTIALIPQNGNAKKAQATAARVQEAVAKSTFIYAEQKISVSIEARLVKLGDLRL